MHCIEVQQFQDGRKGHENIDLRHVDTSLSNRICPRRSSTRVYSAPAVPTAEITNDRSRISSWCFSTTTAPITAILASKHFSVLYLLGDMRCVLQNRRMSLLYHHGQIPPDQRCFLFYLASKPVILQQYFYL